MDNTKEFETDEVIRAIKRSKNTVPGINKISNELLKSLPQCHIIKITSLFNKLWNNKTYPEKWKQVKIVAINKPNKAPTDIDGYRSISLLPTLSKIFNKLIKQRMDDFVEVNSVLPKNCFAFRKNKGINDYFITLSTEVKKNKNNGLMTALVLTDTAKAFDNVSPNILSDTITRQGFPELYVDWILNFMINRNLIMENGKKRIASIRAKGYHKVVLSVHCYLIFIRHAYIN